MSELNVLFTIKRPQIEIDYFCQHLGEGYNIILPENYSEDEILNYIKKADVLLGDYVTKSMLDQGNVKLVQIPQTGVENLDIELLKGYDIPVCNSHSNALAVAESAVALLLGIAKKIPYHDKILREGDWNRSLVKDTRESLSTYGSYVSNKIIGFIGYGNNAKKIAKLLNGFNCEFMAIVNNKNKEYEELDFIGDKDDLDYVLSNVDYLIVAAPLTNDTRGILNMSNLINMKKTAYIINIARGELIDEKSLYNILDSNLIRGAAIDVWYNNPKETENILPSKEYDFHRLNNIILSPHRADFIYDEYPYLDDAIDNIVALKEGRTLINKLNLSKGY